MKKKCLSCGKEVNGPGAEHLLCALKHPRISSMGWVFWALAKLTKMEFFREKEEELKERILKTKGD